MLESQRLIFSYFVKKEQGMFKIVMCLVLFLSSNIFAMQDQKPVVDENIKPLRISFFIDDHSEIFGKNGSTAVTNEFARALSQKVSHATIKHLL